MHQERFGMSTLLVKTLDQLMGYQVTAEEPVVLLAAYLDALAKSYGLSESGQIHEDPLKRVDPPAPAMPLLNHFLKDGAGLTDVDALRNLLYLSIVEISRDPSAGKALNKTQPLDEVRLRYLAQIYWNLEGNQSRSLLPIRPGQITRNGSDANADIPTENADDDFATMTLTKRRNAKASYKASGHSFEKSGSLLAVLTAQHIINSGASSPPQLGGANLTRTENDAGKLLEVAIVWDETDRPLPTADRPALKNPVESGCNATITSRARARHAIDSLEQDLRQAIDSYLLGLIPPEEVFGPDFDKISTRRASVDLSDTDSLTGYLYPQEAYDALLRHPAALPVELVEILRSNLPALDNFLPIRNRVMHGRPLQPNDLEETEAVVERFRSETFRITTEAFDGLISDTGWQPRSRAGSEPPERVFHNLPEADFNETGLLGRDHQVNDIVTKVKSRRAPITLIGEGGIGKTALALEVCYRLIDDAEPSFDTILWISLKTEQLTPAGVQELANALRDIDGATGALGKAIDDTFQGGADELAHLLGDRTTLVVIDNLETVHGDEVVILYDALPTTVTFLFTSRVGLGQLERPVPVGPLDETSADQLFRKFARSSGVPDLATLPQAAANDILRDLRYSPLAIRWYILSIEAGKTPTNALRNQQELLQFCVANVVDALGSDERLLLEVLRALDRPVSFDEVAVISEIGIDTLRRGAQRLTQSSLVVRSQFADVNESELLALSSTARAFLPKVSSAHTIEDIFRRETAYNKDRESEQKWNADRGRYFDPNLIFERSTSDEPVAHLLRRALRAHKAGDPEGASAAMARARALNAGYFEVDRIDAFLASTRKDTANATMLYRAALNNCREEEERCWVSYFYAAHLARDAGEARDIPTAIKLAEETHAFFNTYATAHHLGNFYFWDGRFEDGKRLIEWAIAQAPTLEFRRKATTSLVECLRQWADADLADGSSASSLAHVLHGLRVGSDLHATGSTDEKLMRSIVRAAASALKAVTRMPAELGREEEAELAKAIERITEGEAFKAMDSWRYLEYEVAFLSDDMRTRLAPGIPVTVTDTVPKERLRGTIVNVGQTYGFIAHPNFPNNVFFQAGWLVVPTRIEDLVSGSTVEFTPDKNDKGQNQALHVTPVASANTQSFGPG